MQGRLIKGGMVYVGSDAPSVTGYWTEPCLIDPDLPIDWNHADWDGATMAHWPSYDKAGPRARAAYLAWLAGGRRDEFAHIGYVFLFFYGLERRLFVDLGCDLDHPDVPIIAAEILRLLIIYGANRSFSEHAGSLLALLEGLSCLNTDIEDIEPVLWDPDRSRWGIPLAVRIAIGKYVANGSRIPAEWALSYFRHHPETRLRTPAKRCQDEFDELFKARYRARFRGGMKVRRPARNLTLAYQAASNGFRGLMILPSSDTPGASDLAGDFELGYGGEVLIALDAIPDITSASSLIRKLSDLAEECTDELDAYSRFIGKNPDGARTAPAISLLPDVLLASLGGPIIDDLRNWISEMLDGRLTVVVPFDELVERWSPGRTDKLTKREATWLASLLGKMGVGIEPDVRFGTFTPKPGTNAVLFPLPNGAADAASPAYAGAMPLVHLAAVVATADGPLGPDQRRFVAEHVEQIPGLDAADRRRLACHLEFLAAGKLGMHGMKNRVAAFPEKGRAGIGEFLVGVGAADGFVSPEEITRLTKLFGYLGLDDAAVYRQVLAIDTGDRGPVTVREAQSTTRWVVPDTVPLTPRPSTVSLDPAKVRARLAETARVTALLTDIFTDDDTAAPNGPPPTGPEPESMIEGLDEVHSALLRALVVHSGWDRGEVERVAGSLGLPFLDSALDVINEAAMAVCGEPVVEGDDPVELNAYAIEELL